MAAGSTYTPLATQTLGSAAASVTFSSISGAYTDLVLIIAGVQSVADVPYIQFNSDTATNYSRTQLSGDGSSASSSRNSNNAKIIFSGGDLATFNAILNIQNYANTTTYKTALIRSNSASERTSAAVGVWRSTSAITSLLIANNSANTFAAGSTFTLYGIAAA